MSALYEMRYNGVVGLGHGAIYIGKGVIVGVDVMGGRYTGSYAEHGGQLVGQVIMTAAGPLVTGQDAAPGTQIPININFSNDFAGKLQTVTVGGSQVGVVFEKVGDIP